MSDLMRIESGDLLFLRGRTWLSRLIQWRSLSQFSHVGIVWRDDYDKLYVIESVEGHGVRLVPFSVWEDWHMPIDVYRMEHSHPSPDSFEWAMSQLGKPYASWKQFVLSWGFIGRRVSRRLKLPADQDPDRWFCSEFAARFLQINGVKLHAAPARMTPGDVSLLSSLDHVGRIFPRMEHDGKDSKDSAGSENQE